MRAARAGARLWALAVAFALQGCGPAPAPPAAALPLELVPLPQATQSFESPHGPARTDSFLVDRPRLSAAADRRRMAALLAALPAPEGAPLALRSAYVYRRTERLDERYPASAAVLRSAHAGDLLAYARWTRGTLDMMLVIDNGRVVHDLQADRPVEPPWEFR